MTPLADARISMGGTPTKSSRADWLRLGGSTGDTPSGVDLADPAAPFASGVSSLAPDCTWGDALASGRGARKERQAPEGAGLATHSTQPARTG